MRTYLRPILTPLLAAAAALAAAACDGSPSGPAGQTLPESRLVFLRASSYAPPLATLDTSFWAVAGENAEVRIDYAPLPGQAEGERCMEFKVPGNALLRRPDGTRFQRDDSVRITVRVVDADRFNFEFQPAGLVFDPGHPAELRVHYAWADPDFNADGVVDGRDDDFDFGIWRQERDGLPWTRIGSARLKDAREVRATIQGFTKYAMAGGH
jgi:hypothetical protein